MMSLQEISDRLEIQDLVFRYAELVDSRRFDELREVFTADVHVDYSAFGGSVGDLEQTLAFLRGALDSKVFPHTQHLNANVQVTVNGDTAAGRIMCFNPMQLRLPDGGEQIFFLGLWYVDSYRRTAEGWRIARREEEKSWVFNTPDVMKL